MRLDSREVTELENKAGVERLKSSIDPKEVLALIGAKKDRELWLWLSVLANIALAVLLAAMRSRGG